MSSGNQAGGFLLHAGQDAGPCVLSDRVASSPLQTQSQRRRREAKVRRFVLSSAGTSSFCPEAPVLESSLLPPGGRGPQAAPECGYPRTRGKMMRSAPCPPALGSGGSATSPGLRPNPRRSPGSAPRQVPPPGLGFPVKCRSGGGCGVTGSQALASLGDDRVLELTEVRAVAQHYK